LLTVCIDRFAFFDMFRIVNSQQSFQPDPFRDADVAMCRVSLRAAKSVPQTKNIKGPKFHEEGAPRK